MSYTMFNGTAICTIPSFFELDEFIENLHAKCISENNYIFENYGENENKVDIDFNEYIDRYGDKIYLETDSEENDNEVWEWLIEQFVQVMNSDAMAIKTATIDSRCGVDVWVCLKTKDGGSITLDDLIQNYPGLTKESYNLY